MVATIIGTMIEAVARAISVPHLTELLCDTINSESEWCINDRNRKFFCDILESLYLRHNDDLFAAVEELKFDTLDMISNNQYNNDDDSDSHLSLICELIIEALEAGVGKEHKELLEDILHYIYLSSIRTITIATEDLVKDAKEFIRIVKNSMILIQMKMMRIFSKIL